MRFKQTNIHMQTTELYLVWFFFCGNLFLINPLHAQTLAEANTSIQSGEYETALEILREIEDEEALLVHARLLIDIGRQFEAEELLQREESVQAITLRAEILIRLGQYNDAINLLDPAVEGENGPHAPARFWRGQAFDAIGRHSRARLDYQDFARAYQNGQITTAEDLMLAAQAMIELDRYQDANMLLQSALELDPESIPIRVVWADLFLEKYRPDEAETLLEEVLIRNPNHAYALVLRGYAALKKEHDLSLAQTYANRALEIYPNMPIALLLLSKIAIDTNYLDQASEYISLIAENGPQHLQALTLEAAIAYLRDDMERYSELEAEVLMISPNYAAFYHQIGEHAARVFRYEAALSLQQQAISLAANYWPAFISLGVAHSRMGNDEQARAFLQRAFDADPFNATAFYMVNLYEQTLENYIYLNDPIMSGLRYRFHQNEQAVLSRYIPDATRDVFQRYEERYNFTPEMPLSIEVFSDTETFAIRSVGLPIEGLQGVCFGHVVTSHSPSEGNFNWLLVLEHEMSHVFSLQRSNYRVPRWLTEGMAEYDTFLTDPRWQREEELSMVRALSNDSLISIADLTSAFTNSTDLNDVVVAYYQASLTVRFIATQWSYQHLLQMLDGYANEERTIEVLESVLERDISQFDDEFETWLRSELGSLTTLWEPDLFEFSDLEHFAENAESGDPDSLAAFGVSQVVNGHLELGTTTLQNVLSLDPNHSLANLALGKIAYEMRNLSDAETHLLTVLNTHESYTVHFLLGAIAKDSGRIEEAIEHFQHAATLYPRSPDPQRMLIELFDQQNNLAGAIAALEILVMLDENDFHSAFRYAQHLVREQDPQAFEATSWAAQVDPFSRDLHTLYGQVAHEQNNWQIAQRELELELAAGPRDRQQTLQLLLTTYQALQLTNQANEIELELQ